MGTRAPRFLFVRLVQQGDDSDDTSDQSLIGWRLVAPNNRELGHSAELFKGYAACRDAALRLQAKLDAAVATMAFDDDAQWRWELALDNHAAAVCSRSYWRRVECEYGLGQFLANVRSATVMPDLRTVRRTASRPASQTATPPGVERGRR